MQALRLKHHHPHPLIFFSSLTKSFNLYNCTPTPNSYYFVIKTLIKTSQFHQIPSVLKHLKNNKKFETLKAILTDLIEFYAAKNDFTEVIELFFKIPRFRCVPSVDSHNCLILVLCRRNEGLKIMPHVLVNSWLINIHLEETSFTILIKALCRFRKSVNAIGFLRHMVYQGINIDEQSFTLILSTLCHQNNLECNEVMCWLEEMKKLGFCLERMDWGNVIRFLVQRNKGMEAFEALNKMKFDVLKT